MASGNVPIQVTFAATRKELRSIIASSFGFTLDELGLRYSPPKRRAVVLSGGPFDGDVMEFDFDDTHPFKDELLRVEPEPENEYALRALNPLSDLRIHRYRLERRWRTDRSNPYGFMGLIEAALYIHQGRA